jgi:acylaminoacyl-peptidase
VVSSDKEPGALYLLDTQSGKLTELLRSMPWLNPSLLADREAIKLKARDGLDLYGYITLPKGKQTKLPLIIIPHGGPHGIRDSWVFDREAQLFANRGYAVLQVNFRGSGGYGRQFLVSGFQKWHTTMQDDLTDAVNWAVAEGIADRNRLCIYGGSYGGYSALMSPIREPDLYKCAVGYVGVYDMPLMYGRGDVPARPEGRTYLERVIGTDENELRAMSPVYNLDKLKAALFLVHGEKDVRAHFQHYKELTAALDARGYAYEFLTKPKEGHGFFKEENNIELYTKMLTFFDKHIGQSQAKTEGSKAVQ